MARSGTRHCQRCNQQRQLKFFKPRGRVCTPCQTTRVSAASRGTRLVDTYGIDLADYDQLMAHQGGVCAICGGKRRGNLDVDHSHKTLLIRGALCRRCNRRLLPACLDNPAILQRAIEYLTAPPAVDAIGERYAPT